MAKAFLLNRMQLTDIEQPARRTFLSAFAAGALGMLSPGLRAQDLENLAAEKDFQSHRITSSDPTGGNADFRVLDPGQTLVFAEIQSAGRIVHFRDNITSKEAHHLQYHILRMYWDGETRPSVEVPVGDFFAVGFGFTEEFRSALMCIDHQPGKPTDPAAYGAARNCYIPMPFARSARVTLSNEGKEPSQHWFEVNYRTYQTAPRDQLYFHAQYRQGCPPPEGPHLILDATGHGQLIGCVLSVKNNDVAGGGKATRLF